MFFSASTIVSDIMDDVRPVDMSPTEIEEFLGVGGNCVLSLAADDQPYAIPVSYGFDPDDREFLLRLGFKDDSEKATFYSGEDPARLVAYEQRDNGEYRSVIATGTLHELTDEELTPEIVEKLNEAELPLFDIWYESKRELDFTINRFEVDELTGKRAERSD